MRMRIAMPILAGAILALAPGGNGPSKMNISVVRGYLDRMGARYVPHPKSEHTLVVTRAVNDRADSVDLYVDLRQDNTLVLTAYAKGKGGYFSLSRAASREKMLRRLLAANHYGFATFFVDEQEDVGVRFTFTTEDGVGFESFRVAATELLRIADEYSPILEDYMRKN
ncbi:MAG TPA: hypothetical protein VKC34_08200 [Blastocatellia bacterium]|nr:hypothetical protein [Blastocatellia bacterium]